MEVYNALSQTGLKDSQTHSNIIIGPHCPSLTLKRPQAIPLLSILPLTLYLNFIHEDT